MKTSPSGGPQPPARRPPSPSPRTPAVQSSAWPQRPPLTLALSSAVPSRRSVTRELHHQAVCRRKLLVDDGRGRNGNDLPRWVALPRVAMRLGHTAACISGHKRVSMGEAPIVRLL